MTLDDVKRTAAGLGLGALFTWLGSWLVSREKRLGVEARANATVERERVKTTGETDVAALRAEQDTAKIALDMANRERDRYERSVLGHMECLAKVEHLNTRLELLEAEHSGCPERISRLETQIHVMSNILIEKGLLPALKEPAE